MATTLSSFETQHEDIIHDAQVDYYGKRLATCSSDRSIKIFEVNNDTQTLLATLNGHEGPVWQVCWAHPKFGSILASCSYDRSVIIWKEQEANPSSAAAPGSTQNRQSTWTKLFQYHGHDLSVNSISWAPHDYGLCLACASSDGTVSILTYQPAGGDKEWDVHRFIAHQVGVNAISWSPVVNASSSSGAPLLTPSTSRLPQQGDSNSLSLRLVTGGSDNLVKIWLHTASPAANNTNVTQWQLEQVLAGHNDWVRDVQWAPNVGLPYNTIASASQDGVVKIWTQEAPNKQWGEGKDLEPSFDEVVWRLSWSLTGNILAVTSGDNKVTLWKESLDHKSWKNISSIDL